MLILMIYLIYFWWLLIYVLLKVCWISVNCCYLLVDVNVNRLFLFEVLIVVVWLVL